MKKLMISAFAVAFAAVTQAAMLDWSFYDWSDDGDFEGMKVYAMLGDTAKTDWTSASEIASASIDNATLAGDDSGYIFAAGQAKSDSLVKGTDASLYFVVVDSVNNKFDVTEVATVDGSLIYGEQESTPGAFEGLDSDYLSGEWKTFAAPEPTSGLLLLLGVAGLALRRRRA